VIPGRLAEVPEAAQRIAGNEVVLRAVNERIAEKTFDLESRGLTSSDETSEYLCACGRPDCTESMNLTLAEFRKAHERVDQSIVVPGHHLPAIEDVVDEHDGYAVVRTKPGHRPADLDG